MNASQITVRWARAADLDAVVAIEQASFSDPWSRDSFESALGLSHMLFVVAEGTLADAQGRGAGNEPEVLGFAVALLLLDEAEVADIAVMAQARGRRIGGLLLDRITREAHARGVRSLYLEVRESNSAARALYDSRSFAHVGRRRGYYRTPSEDALLMRRDL